MIIGYLPERYCDKTGCDNTIEIYSKGECEIPYILGYDFHGGYVDGSFDHAFGTHHQWDWEVDYIKVYLLCIRKVGDEFHLVKKKQLSEEFLDRNNYICEQIEKQECDRMESPRRGRW